jgi:hypothetical protein
VSVSVEAVEDASSTLLGFVPGARSHTIVAAGPDEAGVEAVAIWRVGPLGQAVGAWVVALDPTAASATTVAIDSTDFPATVESAGTEPDLAAILALCAGDLVVDWDPATIASTLDRIAAFVGAEAVATLRGHARPLTALVAEIVERRDAYQAAFEAFGRTSRSKPSPLLWPDLPPEDPSLLAKTLLGDARISGATPIAYALALATALRRVIRAWQEVETVRLRRSALRDLAEAEPLPPRWLGLLRQAAGGDGAEGR